MVAYGALLPQSLLDIPRHGWVNLHFSVLPAWRGAAPVQHAIMHGDDVTGASTFRVVAQLGTGPVYGVVTEPARPTTRPASCSSACRTRGRSCSWPRSTGLRRATIQAVPQPAEGVSFAPKITPADARVDWKLPAHVVDRLIRACTPDPGAWTEFEGARLKLGPVSLDVPPDLLDLAPGELLAERQAVFVGTGSHPVRLGEVQAEGKRRMTAAYWARGLRSAWPCAAWLIWRATLSIRARPVPAAAVPVAASPAAGRAAMAVRTQIRPGGPPTTCCARSQTGMPTPTCCCPPSSGNAA